MSALLKRLLRLPDVLDIRQSGKSKLYTDIKNDSFPRPIKNGRLSYWIADEIALWQQNLIAQRDAKLKGKSQKKSKAA
jgi:predicted DNA-binding transcriptional regulator AlpA